MSDFLTRIASLTRGETAVVKPRLPGHFAPLPETDPVAPPDDATLAHGANRQGVERNHSVPQPPPGPGPVAPGARANSHEPNTGESRAESRRTPAHAPMPARGEAGNADTPGPTPAGTPPSPGTVVNPASRQTPAGRDGADGVPDFAGDSKIRPAPLQADNNGDRAPLRANDPATPAPVSPQLPALLVRTQPAGREETGLPDLPGLPESPQRAQNEPVVHINIGRIEVRANTSAPPPQPRIARPQPQSSLSLQDYLARGRTGGKHP